MKAMESPSISDKTLLLIAYAIAESPRPVFRDSLILEKIINAKKADSRTFDAVAYAIEENPYIPSKEKERLRGLLEQKRGKN